MVLLPNILLARFGYARCSLIVAITMTIGLNVDFFYNFSWLRYPHWLMGLPTFVYPLSMAFAIGAVLLGIKACAEKL